MSTTPRPQMMTVGRLRPVTAQLTTAVVRLIIMTVEVLTTVLRATMTRAVTAVHTITVRPVVMTLVAVEETQAADGRANGGRLVSY